MTLNSRQLREDPRQALKTLIARAPVTGRGRTIWLDNPSNLYLIDRQADAYLDLMADKPYGGGFHAIIRDLIARYSPALLAGFDGAVDLLDLGPGFPDKSFPLLASMRRSHSRACYIPVDISARFLDIAADACRPFGFPVEPRHSLFEELPGQLAKEKGLRARLIMMGVTFMNYTPGRILPLLAKLLRRGDSAIVAVELFQSEREELILAPYRTGKARAFNFLPLEIVGVPERGVRYFTRFARNRIEMGFEVIQPIDLGEVRLQAGQEIVTALSYRYKYEELTSILGAQFLIESFCDSERTCAVVRLRTKDQDFLCPSERGGTHFRVQARDTGRAIRTNQNVGTNS